MTMTQSLFAFMATAPGQKLEYLSVDWFGYSPMTRFYTRMNGLEYNHPLLLTTVGRKTGKHITVVLPWFEIDGKAVICGSVGGRPTDPAWALNLRKNPRAQAQIYREKMTIRARLAEGPERAACWDYLVRRVPDYAIYQQRAKEHRVLPVFILEREDGKRVVRGNGH